MAWPRVIGAWLGGSQLRGVMDSDGCADTAGPPALGTMWAVPCPQQEGKEEQTPGRCPSHSCCALDHSPGSSRPPASTCSACLRHVLALLSSTPAWWHMALQSFTRNISWHQPQSLTGTYLPEPSSSPRERLPRYSGAHPPSSQASSSPVRQEGSSTAHTDHLCNLAVIPSSHHYTSVQGQGCQGLWALVGVPVLGPTPQAT